MEIPSEKSPVFEAQSRHEGGAVWGWKDECPVLASASSAVRSLHGQHAGQIIFAWSDDMKISSAFFLVAGLLIGSTTSAIRGDEPLPKPSELRVLEGFVGTWDTKMTIKPALWTPRERRVTGTTTNKWILGRRFIECKGSDSLPFEFFAHWT
jgi:hypothetical protein